MKLFGTDGIRGRVNKKPITPESVLRIGMAAAKILKKSHGKNMVLIGKDTRLSGYMIESALTSGICSMGMNVLLVGPIPTPGVAYLTRAMRLDAGTVISASHNPFEDNGIKFFGADGFKLSDPLEEEIERLAASDLFPERRPSGEHIGKAFRLDDAAGRYIEFVKSTIPRGADLEGLRVVVDCANGSAYKVTPALLEELGADVITINNSPDGTNINHCCGSTDLGMLKETVLKNSADAGLAHDGDADRTLFVDEQGVEVDGDRVMALWGVEMKKENGLNKDTIVTTVMSNLGIEHYLQRKGIRILRTKVGDRYVVEKMIEGGYNLGGEQSGHIIFLDFNTTGDGPVTALQVLYLLKRKGLPLSELVSDIFLYPQVLKNVKVNRKDIINSPPLKDAVRKAELQLNGRGRVLVRPSGTEPKIRVMVEGSDRELIRRVAQRIAKAIRQTER
ncbi:phosphoglucosamine mutase [bacterium BMS3Bbin06]|nr:phosphoglucosamine mutase [bacterium BMS3Abin08]GBE34424.1 phosphoglucosamine mutase [bacterium BMS3Bbin06]HDO36307.1 phosphoglucosamine mutase [Nitrospirota bacterium]HDY70309.1 phosphoglucosamine mutase [Nitrospirota bacterium]